MTKPEDLYAVIIFDSLKRMNVLRLDPSKKNIRDLIVATLIDLEQMEINAAGKIADELIEDQPCVRIQKGKSYCYVMTVREIMLRLLDTDFAEELLDGEGEHISDLLSDVATEDFLVQCISCGEPCIPQCTKCKVDSNRGN